MSESSQIGWFRLPKITVDIFEGRTPDQKRHLTRALTDAVCEALGVDSRSVQVTINETKREDSANPEVPVSDWG